MENCINLYIVRHGETEYNTEGRVQGWCNSDLTQKGVSDALATGRGLKDIEFDFIYSSDLGRAKDTAENLLTGMGKDKVIITDEGLRERYMGSLEKKTVHQGLFKEAAEHANLEGHEDKFDIEFLSALYEKLAGDGTIEPLNKFAHRLMGSLKKIVDKSAERDLNILVVSHGLSIMTLIYAVTGDKFVPDKIQNLSVTKIAFKDNCFHIKHINDMSYYEKGQGL